MYGRDRPPTVPPTPEASAKVTDDQGDGSTPTNEPKEYLGKTDPKKVSTEAIIGISVGVIIAVFVLIGVALALYFKRQKPDGINGNIIYKNINLTDYNSAPIDLQQYKIHTSTN